MYPEWWSNKPDIITGICYIVGIIIIIALVIYAIGG